MSFFEDLISDISLVLKQNGFSKSGTTYFLRNENIGVVNIQKSQSNTDTLIKFTINMGIYSTKLAHTLPYDRPTEKPDVSRCHWRARIGDFMPERTDFWWTADLNKSNEVIKNEVLNSLNSIVIPNIKERLNDKSLLQALRNDNSSGLTEFELYRNISTLIKIEGSEQEYILFLSEEK